MTGAVSTRVRLARNVCELPFPARMTPAQREALISQVSAALLASPQDGFSAVSLTDANRLEAQGLVERHLISPELAAGDKPRAVLLSRDQRLSVMVGEEDHLRIQALLPGLALETALAEAFRADTLLDGALPYAFEEERGYLTACPTNLGTGLRASVMLHLPILTETGALRAIANTAGKMGLAVRGLYGEGSKAHGALYQISNQVTLGLSEEEIVARVGSVVEQILAREAEALAAFREKSPSVFENRVWRALGLLQNARLLSAEEGIALLSDLRLGLGILPGVEEETLSALLTDIQPVQLILRAGEMLTPEARDRLRADVVRARLQNRE